MCGDLQARKTLEMYEVWYAEENVGEHLVERYITKPGKLKKRALNDNNEKSVGQNEGTGDAELARRLVDHFGDKKWEPITPKMQVPPMENPQQAIEYPQELSHKATKSPKKRKRNTINGSGDILQHVNTANTDNQANPVTPMRNPRIKKSSSRLSKLGSDKQLPLSGVQSVAMTKSIETSPLAGSGLSEKNDIFEVDNFEIVMNDDVIYESGSRGPRLRGKVWPGMAVFDSSIVRRNSVSGAVASLPFSAAISVLKKPRRSSTGEMKIIKPRMVEPITVENFKRRRLDEEQEVERLEEDELGAAEFSEEEYIFGDESDIDADGIDDDSGLFCSPPGVDSEMFVMYRDQEIVGSPTACGGGGEAQILQQSGSTVSYDAASSSAIGRRTVLSSKAANLTGKDNRYSEKACRDSVCGINSWNNFLTQENFPLQALLCHEEDRIGKDFLGNQNDILKEAWDNNAMYNASEPIEQNGSGTEEDLEIVHENGVLGMNTLNQAWNDLSVGVGRGGLTDINGCQ